MSALLSIVLSAFSVFSPHTNLGYGTMPDAAPVSTSDLTPVHTSGLYGQMPD